MLDLDRIPIVPLMFTNVNVTLARLAPHAKVSGVLGAHAPDPLAADGACAYLSGLSDLLPNDDFAVVSPHGAPSHGL